MLPASRYLLLGSSWSGCAFFSSSQWCYFPRTCLLSLGLFGAPQSFRKEILVKKYLLWIIQWPLALVLRAIMKSWSVPLLSMQLLILDTPIISLFSLVLNKSHFFFFSWKSQSTQHPLHSNCILSSCSIHLSGLLFLLFWDEGVRPIAEIIIEQCGAVFPLLLSVQLPVIHNVRFDFFKLLLSAKNDLFI